MKPLIWGQGWVMHQRTQKKDLSFRYPIFNFLIPIDNELSSSHRLSWWPLLSLHANDYLLGQKTWMGQIQSFLSEKLNYQADEIYLQTIPKMFGYVFNPVSFWYCYKNKNLDAVLCEVNNTFGDRHFYFVKLDQNLQSEQIKKVFHVSPFFPIEGHYEFKFDLSEFKSMAQIDYFDKEKNKVLVTQISLNLSPFDSSQGWRLLFVYGWMTPLIVLRIHFLALKLWLKRKKFFRRPQSPIAEVTGSNEKL